MTLFKILTRRLAAGKMKVTQKLLDRLRREAGGKHTAKPRKPPGRKHHGPAMFCCATLAAACALLICIPGAQLATGAPSSKTAVATSGYSAAALYNQANALARAGKTGLAVLDYERAQLLAPNDANIAANLHTVRAKAGLPDASEGLLTRGLMCAPPNTLAWLGSLGLALACMSVLLVRLHPQRRLAFASLTVVGALLAATAIGSAITMWPKINQAVVIVRDAPAGTSPVLVAEPAFKLREGETVTVRSEHRGFVLVQTIAGRYGWVAPADIERVLPQSADRVPSSDRT
jgi:hypothetical protein